MAAPLVVLDLRKYVICMKTVIYCICCLQKK